MVPINIPRVAIAGLRGGCGKTLVALGLSAAFRGRDTRVLPFKKGPDYIDAAWHALAAGEPCRNLDTFMMGAEEVRRTFLRASDTHAVSLIEGNRGVFDGMDAAGTHSTAELAKLLKCPVVLVLDCTKSTRTVASAVIGCRGLDPNLDLAGVVLNRVAGSRHEQLVRQAIEQYTSVPVLGAIPRLGDAQLGERHLGLLPPTEHPHAEQAVELARTLVDENVDVSSLQVIAESAVPWEIPPEPVSTITIMGIDRPRIGVIRDEAFNFYYPENLEQLEQRGADLIEVNALRDAQLPSLDGLYIGGGFPETHAAQLSSNDGFRDSLRTEVERGLPVYAECGGLTFLCEAIVVGHKTCPMVGVFPATFEIASRPEGHGYAVMEVDSLNPFFETGSVIHGHEFRYSRLLSAPPPELATAYCVKRGKGFDGVRDGLCYKNVLASFCHIHASGMEQWAEAIVSRARRFRRSVHREEPIFDGV
jgi:cobyrinic acid a,c-diamide synthase